MTRATHRTVLLALLTAPTLVGCAADMTYDRLRLGQQPREYDGKLPAERSRRTDIGVCALTREPGRVDATVILLTHDRRIWGKLQSTYVERNWGVKVEHGYRLRGELDPRLSDLPGAGPIDTLRAIAGDLTHYEGERVATDAHAWIAAGIVRLVQRWPNVSDAGVDTGRLTELFARVPGGGEAQISVDAQGVYRFSYSQGRVR